MNNQDWLPYWAVRVIPQLILFRPWLPAQRDKQLSEQPDEATNNVAPDKGQREVSNVEATYPDQRTEFSQCFGKRPSGLDRC